jgi:hypothetical protein
MEPRRREVSSLAGSEEEESDAEAELLDAGELGCCPSMLIKCSVLEEVGVFSAAPETLSKSISEDLDDDNAVSPGSDLSRGSVINLAREAVRLLLPSGE